MDDWIVDGWIGIGNFDIILDSRHESLEPWCTALGKGGMAKYMSVSLALKLCCAQMTP